MDFFTYSTIFSSTFLFVLFFGNGDSIPILNLEKSTTVLLKQNNIPEGVAAVVQNLGIKKPEPSSVLLKNTDEALQKPDSLKLTNLLDAVLQNLPIKKPTTVLLSNKEVPESTKVLIKNTVPKEIEILQKSDSLRSSNVDVSKPTKVLLSESQVSKESQLQNNTLKSDLKTIPPISLPKSTTATFIKSELLNEIQYQKSALKPSENVEHIWKELLILSRSKRQSNPNNTTVSPMTSNTTANSTPIVVQKVTTITTKSTSTVAQKATTTTPKSAILVKITTNRPTKTKTVVPQKPVSKANKVKATTKKPPTTSKKDSPATKKPTTKTTTLKKLITTIKAATTTKRSVPSLTTAKKPSTTEKPTTQKHDIKREAKKVTEIDLAFNKIQPMPMQNFGYPDTGLMQATGGAMVYYYIAACTDCKFMFSNESALGRK